MEVLVNGAKAQLPEASSLADVLVRLGYDSPFVAVALNRACIRRADLGSTPVHPGDQIEILAPMAGG